MKSMTRAEQWVVQGVICVGLLWCGVARAEVSPEIFEAFEGDTITITTTHGLELTGKLKKVNLAKMSIVFIQAGGKVALIKIAEVASVKATAELGGAAGTPTNSAAQSGQPAQAVVNPECSQLAARLAEVQQAEQSFERAKTVCSAGGGVGSAVGEAALNRATGSIPFVGGFLRSAGGKAIGAGVESACLKSAEADKLAKLSDEYNRLNTKCNGAGAVAYGSASLTKITEAQGRRGGAGVAAKASSAPQGMSPELNRAYQHYLRSGKTGTPFPLYLEQRASSAQTLGAGLLFGMAVPGLGLMMYGLMGDGLTGDAGTMVAVLGGSFSLIGFIGGTILLDSRNAYRRFAQEAKALQKTSSVDGLQLRGFAEIRDVDGRPAGAAMTFSF